MPGRTTTAQPQRSVRRRVTTGEHDKQNHVVKRYKLILGIFLVNLALLGIGIVIIELQFGAWLKPHNMNPPNVIKNKTYKFDASRLYETVSPIITYSRDKYGLRGVYGDDPSRIDLLTVGGSTTDQRYIADGSTWQDVIQKQFASTGTPIVVANAGVDGQSTIGHIKNFDWWFPYIPQLKPKYILFYIGLNDFYINEHSNSDPFVDPNQNPLIAAIRQNSALWHAARTIRGMYLAMIKLKIGHRGVDFTKVQWTREPVQNSYGFMSGQLDAYATRLRILVDRTRQFGSQPIFVTQPSRHFRRTKNGVEGEAHFPQAHFPYEGRHINGVDYYHMIGRFNSVMETVSREEDVFFIDLAGESEWADDDFYDFYHMTPRGARKVGLYLFERLRDIVNTAEPGTTPAFP